MVRHGRTRQTERLKIDCDRMLFFCSCLHTCKRIRVCCAVVICMYIHIYRGSSILVRRLAVRHIYIQRHMLRAHVGNCRQPGCSRQQSPGHSCCCRRCRDGRGHTRTCNLRQTAAINAGQLQIRPCLQPNCGYFCSSGFRHCCRLCKTSDGHTPGCLRRQPVLSGAVASQSLVSEATGGVGGPAGQRLDLHAMD